jgi:DNA-binding LacI/PurR family transcriptional regulator
MGIATAIFYRNAGGLDVDTFRIDNRQAGRTATRHLLELGHRQIACIRPISMALPSGQRVNGYEDALREAGLSPDPDCMPLGNNLISGGRAAVCQMLENKSKFTAIFASNDAMAVGALRALRDEGYRIPADISIVGIDDIQLASYVEPPLTTIAQPKQEAGSLAVQYLIERIEGKYSGGPRDILLETELVIRSSTAPTHTRKD